MEFIIVDLAYKPVGTTVRYFTDTYSTVVRYSITTIRFSELTVAITPHKRIITEL